jgi:hypothetical protein
MIVVDLANFLTRPLYSRNILYSLDRRQEEPTASPSAAHAVNTAILRT